MSARDETRICLACNEDGFGPSAFGYYIARELISCWADSGKLLRLTVLNHAAEHFNRQLYRDSAVDVRPIDSLIRLPKPDGEVHVQQTLQRLRSYAEHRTAYADAVRDVLERCDVAIDIGVPLFARAAAQFKIPVRLTVFDHSWAATLRLIAAEEWAHIYRANPMPGIIERQQAGEIAARIEEDEATASDVFLFEEYITPQEFVAHWKRLGIAPRMLPGVLGPGGRRDEGRARLDVALQEYGQRPAPPDAPLVLVSPGGTPVWDDQLPTLLDAALASSDPGYVLIFAKDLGPALEAHPRLKAQLDHSDRIRYYGPVRGTTQQPMMPAFDRIITRAGGGTVNDALAAGVRMAFVEEPQVQIKLIERECARLGISRPAATLTAFQRHAWECIDGLVRMPLPEPTIRPHGGAEKSIVQRIVSLLN